MYGGKADALGGHAERRFEDSSVDAGVYQKGKQLAQWVGDEEALASAAAALCHRPGSPQHD